MMRCEINGNGRGRENEGLQDTIRLVCRENGKENRLFVRLQYTPANHNCIQVALDQVPIYMYSNRATYIRNGRSGCMES
jgi:hypothetical protein